MVITWVIINDLPFSELAELVELSQDEEENKDSADDGCDSDVVVPVFECVNHISGAKILNLK